MLLDLDCQRLKLLEEVLILIRRPELALVGASRLVDLSARVVVFATAELSFLVSFLISRRRVQCFSFFLEVVFRHLSQLLGLVDVTHCFTEVA